MTQKQHAPAARIRRTGAYREIMHKGRKFFLNTGEYRLYSLLMEGQRLATFDIARRLNIPDPRSTVRYLRRMGIGVSDCWCHENGLRFKRYFIRKEALQ